MKLNLFFNFLLFIFGILCCFFKKHEGAVWSSEGVSSPGIMLDTEVSPVLYTSMDLPESDKRKWLFRIFDTGISADPLDEITQILQLTAPSIEQNLLAACHRDIHEIFNGHYPGFKANNNKYHNLRHTYAVALATARLFHGLSLEGQHFSTTAVLKGMMSAYFHDTGLLLRSSDAATNGAEYTHCHEIRSIQALEKYLESRNLGPAFRKDCSAIIRCTNIEIPFQSIPFNPPEIKRVAQIVGTADISAQMADRYYLERLPHLYQERRAGRVPNNYTSAFDLMSGTPWFYNNVILKRLEKDLGNTARFMRVHFNARWSIDRDLYKENIQSNIDYLQKVVARCTNKPEELCNYLQRQPPSSEDA